MSLFGFGRTRTTAVEQLATGQWYCRSCAKEHGWPFDLAAFAPDFWPGNEMYEPNDALRLDGNFLSEDFCVLEGRYFMMRCVLPIPVNGMANFGFGCWSTLSRTNFEAYVAGFDNGIYPDDARWTGWLCNRLADFVGDDPLGLWVQPRAGRRRPLLWVADDDHPLAVAQDEGINPQRMLAILAFYGHEPGT